MPVEQVRVYEIGGFDAEDNPLPPVIVHDIEMAKFVIDTRKKFQENHEIPVEVSTLVSYTREESVRDSNDVPGHPSAA